MRFAIAFMRRLRNGTSPPNIEVGEDSEVEIDDVPTYSKPIRGSENVRLPLDDIPKATVKPAE